MPENGLRGAYVLAIRAMVDITGTLLVPPVIALGLRSVYVDANQAGLLFAGTLVLAGGLSLLLVVKKIQRYGTEYKKLTDTKSPDDGSDARR